MAELNSIRTMAIVSSETFRRTVRTELVEMQCVITANCKRLRLRPVRKFAALPFDGRRANECFQRARNMSAT